MLSHGSGGVEKRVSTFADALDPPSLLRRLGSLMLPFVLKRTSGTTWKANKYRCVAKTFY
jgi:hypothetical protein